MRTAAATASSSAFAAVLILGSSVVACHATPALFVQPVETSAIDPGTIASMAQEDWEISNQRGHVRIHAATLPQEIAAVATSEEQAVEMPAALGVSVTEGTITLKWECGTIECNRVRWIYRVRQQETLRYVLLSEKQVAPTSLPSAVQALQESRHMVAFGWLYSSISAPGKAEPQRCELVESGSDAQSLHAVDCDGKSGWQTEDGKRVVLLEQRPQVGSSSLWMVTVYWDAARWDLSCVQPQRPPESAAPSRVAP